MMGGEGLKEALLWAIRNGLALPDDLEERAWIADVLGGELDPKRGRGRPQKKAEPWNLIRASVEHGMAENFHNWLNAFQHDRELAWLRAEAVRLRREQPNSAAWRCIYDLGTEEGRKSFVTAVRGVGARPCPPAARGGKTPRELALMATVEEYGERWARMFGQVLTSSVVVRIVARAKKSE